MTLNDTDKTSKSRSHTALRAFLLFVYARRENAVNEPKASHNPSSQTTVVTVRVLLIDS